MMAEIPAAILKHIVHALVLGRRRGELEDHETLMTLGRLYTSSRLPPSNFLNKGEK